MDTDLFFHWQHAEDKYGNVVAGNQAATARRARLVVDGGMLLPWAITAMLVAMVALCLYFAVTDNPRLDPLLPLCLRPKRAKS
jgi:hypothetical protein|mmetsp:Transcript_38938/g.69737  ORF Transcript_38938/g.69737 Transcript_38938/m.69737 type:complete len:83 (-) Transcript_38938:329-577(-)